MKNERKPMSLVPYETPDMPHRVGGSEGQAGAADQLRLETDKRIKAEDLHRHQTRELKELNTAIRVLLRERVEVESILEQRFLANVNELILPFLSRLRGTPLSGGQIVCLDIIEHNLRDLSSPLLGKLTEKDLGLTRRELWVAKYVHDGMSIKEISSLLQISESVVKKHRASIRRKLGVGSRKATLRGVLCAINSA